MKRRKRSRIPALEPLEPRLPLTVPFGALPTDTAEYLLGDVLVSIVLLESNGSIDANTENWTQPAKNAVVQKVQTAIEWWEDMLAEFTSGNPVAAPLDFRFDLTYVNTPIVTGYEAISQTSEQFTLWIQDFFNTAIPGQTTSDPHFDIKTFNHAQRVAHDTDWAFTVFVVNDANDADHEFASGSLFPTAFAFPGGEFFVSVASRPEWTFAHEMGHIFWALDEYSGGPGVTRGYYNAPNLNAAVHATSIMDTSYDTAYNTITTPDSTLELVGWRDSDGDGIFDVLDVEHTLTGTGFYDAAAGEYRFVGSSHVNTLRNQNPSGNQSDITINRIRQVQYRLDGAGPWQAIDIDDGYSVDLDLHIPVPSGFTQIELRTFDTRTNVASPTFVGGRSGPAGIGPAGISGFVRRDLNNDGGLEESELGVGGWTVTLTNGANPYTFNSGRIEPDDYDQGDGIVGSPGAIVQVVGGPTGLPTAYAGGGNPASTGSKVFRYLVGFDGPNLLLSESFTKNIQLKFTFENPTSLVQIDAVGNGVIGNGLGDYGRLEIYDANDQLLGRYTTQQLAAGEVETMTLADPQGRIAYAIARGHTHTGVQFDNFHWGPSNSATTDAYGAFSLSYVPSSLYFFEVTPPAGGLLTIDNNPVPYVYTAGVAANDVLFGGLVAIGQNASDRFDVNADTFVDIQDLIAFVAEFRTNGGNYPVPEPPGGVPQPPFNDIDGDGQVTIADLIALVGFLRTGGSAEPPGGGSGSGGSSGGGGESGGGSGEGEPSNLLSSRADSTDFSARDLFALANSRRSPQAEVLPTFEPILLRPRSSRGADDSFESESGRDEFELRFDRAEAAFTIDVLPQLAAAPFAFLGRVDWRAVDHLHEQSAPSRRDAKSQEGDAVADADEHSPPRDPRSKEAHDEVFGEFDRERRRHEDGNAEEESGDLDESAPNAAEAADAAFADEVDAPAAAEL